MQGWIKLHREVQTNVVWNSTTPEQKVIFLTLLMLVNHSANSWEWEGEKYHCEPGQTITSINSICELAGKGITPQKVKTALKKFKKWNILTDKATKQGRLITLVNWAKYQRREEKLTDDLTVEQPTPNRQLTTNKNDNNGIMKEEDGDDHTPIDNKETKDLITIYRDLFKNITGAYPTVNQRDGKVLKDLVTERGYNEAARIVEYYLKHPTKNEKEAGYPLSWLPKAVNRILQNIKEHERERRKFLEPGQWLNESDAEFSRRKRESEELGIPSRVRCYDAEAYHDCLRMALEEINNPGSVNREKLDKGTNLALEGIIAKYQEEPGIKDILERGVNGFEAGESV